MFTDTADYLNDWTVAQREKHDAFLSLAAGLVTSIVAIPLFAKRFRYLGVSGWWSIPAYLLIIIAFFIEAYVPAAVVMSSPLLILFFIIYLGMVFGEELSSIGWSKR
ncbi:hypothetical protein AB4097_11710 [Microvirga sp. 2MCAF35]|uniref:hypothetical protein n=1 Tax=Microvirga sp. 2MCAF35 TaxID=3232987 RepID=UPI003F990844